MRRKSIYAIYKGDKFINLGTLDELAADLNISKSTIKFYTTPSYEKREHKNRYVVIKIDDEDVDEDELISRI